MIDYDVHLAGSVFSTVPAGSATVVLFDSTGDPATGVTLSRRKGYPEIKRAIVRIYMDQNATFNHNSLSLNSTTWRTINGSGSGQAVTANTLFELDCLFIGDDTQLTLVTGTVPTVWEVSVRLAHERALGQ